jgi:hypothetical protein
MLGESGRELEAQIAQTGSCTPVVLERSKTWPKRRPTRSFRKRSRRRAKAASIRT